MTTLTRGYRFSASHRLHSARLTASENERVYGKCNYPFGHGHNYLLQVTAAGPVDAETGTLIPVARLDRLVQDKVLSLFSHRNMNTDIPQFSEMAPTTENVAAVIAEILGTNWPADESARLHRVRIEETGRNAFDLLVPSHA
ncbi:MAG: 6-carboxytetrahydropterin synthase [Bryobacteraceae bacterium]